MKSGKYYTSDDYVQYRNGSKRWELSTIHADNGGFYDNVIHAGRHHRRMPASR
jgi:hypothetical protein